MQQASPVAMPLTFIYLGECECDCGFVKSREMVGGSMMVADDAVRTAPEDPACEVRGSILLGILNQAVLIDDRLLDDVRACVGGYEKALTVYLQRTVASVMGF